MYGYEGNNISDIKWNELVVHKIPSTIVEEKSLRDVDQLKLSNMHSLIWIYIQNKKPHHPNKFTLVIISYKESGQLVGCTRRWLFSRYATKLHESISAYGCKPRLINSQRRTPYDH